MSLFPELHNPSENLLPRDGGLYDYGVVIEQAKSQRWLQAMLKETPWQHDRVRLRSGEIAVTERKVAWYGDSHVIYRYSGIDRKRLPWTANLLRLKQFIETKTELNFNSCLLNLYHDGEEGLGWHQDNESELVQPANIASISFGATRRFAVRHINEKKVREIVLESGQLILMCGVMQQYWQHCVRKETKLDKPRINVTFRQFSRNY